MLRDPREPVLYCSLQTLRDEQYDRLTVTNSNKKDGYRQQNVRQRQKLISTGIIDYEVCMTFY